MILHHVNINSPKLSELTFELKYNYQLSSKIFSFSSNFIVYSMAKSFVKYFGWFALLFFIHISIYQLFCLVFKEDQNQFIVQFSKFIFVFLMIADGYQAIEHFLLGQNAIFFEQDGYILFTVFRLIMGFIKYRLAVYFWFHHIQDKQILTKIFTFCLLSIILAILIYYYTKIFNFIAINLSLLPQILNVAYNNHQQKFDATFIFGLLFLKLVNPDKIEIIFLDYYVYNPHNILQEYEIWSTIKFIYILALFAAQVVVYYFKVKLDSDFSYLDYREEKKQKSKRRRMCNPYWQINWNVN